MKIELARASKHNEHWLVALRVNSVPFGIALGTTADEAYKRALFLYASLEVMEEEGEHDTLAHMGLKP